MKSVIFSLDYEINRVPIADKNFEPAPLEIRVREYYSLVIISLDYLLRQLAVEMQTLVVATSFVLLFFDTIIYIPALRNFFFHFTKNCQDSFFFAPQI